MYCTSEMKTSVMRLYYCEAGLRQMPSGYLSLNAFTRSSSNKFTPSNWLPRVTLKQKRECSNHTYMIDKYNNWEFTAKYITILYCRDKNNRALPQKVVYLPVGLHIVWSTEEFKLACTRWETLNDAIYFIRLVASGPYLSHNDIPIQPSVDLGVPFHPNLQKHTVYRRPSL